MKEYILYNNVNTKIINLNEVNNLGLEKHEAVKLDGRYYQVYVQTSSIDKVKEVVFKAFALLLLALPYLYISYNGGWDKALDKQFLAVPLNLETCEGRVRYQILKETGKNIEGPVFLHQGQKGFLKSVKKALKSISEQLNFFNNDIIPIYREEQPQEYQTFMMAVSSPRNILESLGTGAGGAHVLVDADGNKLGVLKVNSQDTGSLHNQKNNANIFSTELKPGIEANQSVLNEILASTIARKLGIGDATPSAIPVTIRSSRFEHNFETQDEFELCSWHPYVKNVGDLATWEGDIRNLSIQDIEAVNILTWVTNDQDAHNQNYLVYMENNQTRLKKIDNGLILGSGKEHGEIINTFSGQKYLSVMDRPISQEGTDRIFNFDLEGVQDQMSLMGKSPDAIESFGKRVRYLRKIISVDPTITLKEIDNFMVAKSKAGWMV